MPKVPSFLKPPAFTDSERSRVASLLGVAGWTVAVIGIVWAGTAALLPYGALRLALVAPALLASAVALALLRARRLEAGAWVLAFGSWLALTASLLFESQLFSVAGYVVLVFTSALLLGRRGVAVIGSLGIAGTTVVGGLHLLGVTEPIQLLDTPRLTWLGGLVCMLWAAVMVARAATRTSGDIERARHDEEALAQRNRELAASEERFRLLAENAKDLVIELGEDGRPNYVSPSVRSLTGHGPEVLLGRDPIEVVKDLIHPDEFAEMQRMVGIMLEQRPIGPIEYRLRHANGSWIWLETITQVYRTPDGSGRALSITRDVTQRRQAEASLRESERRLRLLIQDSPFPIAVVDASGAPQLANPAFQRLFGMTPDTLRRFLAAHDLWSDPRLDALGLQEELARARAGEVVSIRELAWPGEPGGAGGPLDSRLWVNVVFYPLKDEHGRVEQLVLMLEDTTEARHLEEQLRQAQKMEALGTLAGGIAHDLNNVLSPILGYAELALAGSPAESANAEYLTQILESAERARALVRQILVFSRSAEPERRPLALRGVVSEALGLLRASLPATAEIRSRLAESGDVVVGNPTELYQLVLNLCTNAAQALDDDRGTIEVTLEPVDLELPLATVGGELGPGAFVRLAVRDDGRGMDAPTRERIFDPFFTTKRESQGTGLGLSVVYGIVARHGGGIRVESAPEKGSAFEIYLPRGVAAAEVAAAERVEPAGGRERILLVDDEPAVGRVLRDALSKLGYRVQLETMPLAALAAFRAAPRDFELLITDQTMPGLTGERLAREVHALRPELPILLCTGFHARLDDAAARALGIRECLMKPLRGRELAAAVRRALDLH